MLPLAIIGRMEWVLVLSVLLFFFGLPLALVTVLLGNWLRRTGRTRAFRSYVTAAICGAVAVCALLGAIALNVAVRSHASAQTEYAHIDVLPMLLLVGVWSIVGVAACGCVLFGAWTIWRLVEAQPTRTTPQN